jgi:hypothetical protein
MLVHVTCTDVHLVTRTTAAVHVVIAFALPQPFRLYCDKNWYVNLILKGRCKEVCLVGIR